MRSSANEIELHRLWTTQLYDEHESICWLHRIKIKKPVIEISNSKSFWGEWCPGYRTIKISSRLIIENSWDVVINILKHEMAHQIVSEIFSSDDGHGKLFHKACQVIGLSDDFSKASGDLPKKIMELNEKAISGKSKIFDKINKLFSLAQSNNEHEASLALQKANLLLKKHNLNRMSQINESEYRYKIINHKKKRIENYQKRICSILMDFYFVEIVYSRLYDGSSNELHKTIEILGAKENIVMAEHVYFFLLNQIGFLWKSHRSKTNCRSSSKRSYFLGVIEGFRNKLTQAESKQNVKNHEYASTSALIRAKDRGLSGFMKQRFPRLYKSSSQTKLCDYETYKAGKKEGLQLTIHKGVNESSGFRGRILA